MASSNSVTFNGGNVPVDDPHKNKVFFSSSDSSARAIFNFNTGYGNPIVNLDTLLMVSLSTHRDVYPTVSFGRAGIKGYTTGHRTCAGSMGFLLEDKDPFSDLIYQYCTWINRMDLLQYTLPDELPPFDLILENGDNKQHTAYIMVKSVKIIDSSKNVSLRDVQLTENYSFLAANIFPIQPEDIAKSSNASNSNNDTVQNLFTQTQVNKVDNFFTNITTDTSSYFGIDQFTSGQSSSLLDSSLVPTSGLDPTSLQAIQQGMQVAAGTLETIAQRIF